MNGKSKYAKGEEWRVVCDGWYKEPANEAELWKMLAEKDAQPGRGNGRYTPTEEARLMIIRERLLAKEPAEG